MTASLRRAQRSLRSVSRIGLPLSFLAVAACAVETSEPAPDDSTLASGSAALSTPLARVGRIGVPGARVESSTNPPSMFGVSDKCQKDTMPRLDPRGGEILTNAVIVPVMWGPRVDPRITSNIGNFYSMLASSDIMWSLTREYTANVAQVTRNYQLQPMTDSTYITDDNIGSDLDNSIVQGTIPYPTSNTIFAVHFPPGITLEHKGETSCVDFCGYHSQRESTVARYTWAAMPDLTAPGCRCDLTGEGLLANTTRVASHEIFETITNPYKDGWYDSGHDCEIGDICTSTLHAPNLGLDKTPWAISSWWSNNSNACDTGSDGWSAARPLANPPGPFVFKPGGAMAGNSRFSTTANTFAIGYDGMLWSTGDWWNNGWNPPTPIVQSHNQFTFVPGGGIAVASRVSTDLNTFVIGNDGMLWSAGDYAADNKWHPATPIVGAHNQFRFKPGGGIAATSRHDRVIDTFAIGYDGYLWDTGWFNESGWHPAYSPAHDARWQFQAGAGLAAVGSRDYLEVFVVGNNGHIWSAGRYLDPVHGGRGWLPAYDLTPSTNVVFPPGAQLAATYQNGYATIYIVGNDKHVWTVSGFAGNGNPIAANAPVPLPSQDPSIVFTPGGGIAAIERIPGSISLLTMGNDSHPWIAGQGGALPPL